MVRVTVRIKPVRHSGVRHSGPYPFWAAVNYRCGAIEISRFRASLSVALGRCIARGAVARAISTLLRSVYHPAGTESPAVSAVTLTGLFSVAHARAARGRAELLMLTFKQWLGESVEQLVRVVWGRETCHPECFFVVSRFSVISPMDAR